MKTHMATVARYALLVLMLLAPVLGAFPSFAEAPDLGAEHVAPLDLDDADETDTVDAVIAEWTQPQFVHIQGNQRVHDVEAPEGPPLQLAERPPNV